MNVTLEYAFRCWVRWQDEHHGIAPTVRDFSAAIGRASPCAGDYWLTKLVRAGVLAKDWQSYVARSYYLTPKGEQLAALARAGIVRAS